DKLFSIADVTLLLTVVGIYRNVTEGQIRSHVGTPDIAIIRGPRSVASLRTATKRFKSATSSASRTAVVRVTCSLTTGAPVTCRIGVLTELPTSERKSQVKKYRGAMPSPL